MNSFVHVLIVLFVAAVAIGIFAQAVKNPNGTNQLFAATADTINGVTHGLEGKG